MFEWNDFVRWGILSVGWIRFYEASLFMTVWRTHFSIWLKDNLLKVLYRITSHHELVIRYWVLESARHIRHIIVNMNESKVLDKILANCLVNSVILV